MLGALGVIKLVLFLLGIYQPSPANIRPLYPEEQLPAPAPAQIHPAAPPPSVDAPMEKRVEALLLAEPDAPEPAPTPSEAASKLVITEPQDSESESAPAGGVRYVIQPGDTLWDIAKKSCGGGARYRVLYRKNRGNIRNPHRIWPNQVIEFPDSCR